MQKKKKIRINPETSSRLMLFFVLISLGACHEKLKAVKPTAEPAFRPERITVAVFDFEDNSIGPHPALAGLGRSLADGVSLRLSHQAGLALVDRSSLEKILREISFSSRAFISEEERLRLGKLLGAQYLIFGTYLAIGGDIRIDARIVEVERGLAEGKSLEGLVSERGSLEVTFSKKMSEAFLVKTAARPRRRGLPLSSNDHLQKGLAFERGGHFDQALESYQKAISINPDNQRARGRMEDLLLKELE